MFLNKFRKKCLFWRFDVYVTFGGSSLKYLFWKFDMGFFEEILYKTLLMSRMHIGRFDLFLCFPFAIGFTRALDR